MIRLMGGISLVVAAFLVLGGLYTLYVFEKDWSNYAEGVCPAPPNGVDSAERQACLSEYQQRSGLDVAGGWLLGGLAVGAGGATAFMVGRELHDPWSAPEGNTAES